MSQKSPMRMILENHGLTMDEALKRVSVGRKLMETLYLGLGNGKTIPPIARQLMADLDLTVEEYKSICHPLDKERWKKFYMLDETLSKATNHVEQMEKDGMFTDAVGKRLKPHVVQPVVTDHRLHIYRCSHVIDKLNRWKQLIGQGMTVDQAIEQMGIWGNLKKNDDGSLETRQRCGCLHSIDTWYKECGEEMPVQLKHYASLQNSELFIKKNTPILIRAEALHDDGADIIDILMCSGMKVMKDGLLDFGLCRTAISAMKSKYKSCKRDVPPWLHGTGLMMMIRNKNNREQETEDHLYAAR